MQGEAQLGEQLAARIGRQRERVIGQVVDESVALAARLREERAERDRLEREAEEREQRLAFFAEQEREDIREVAERRRLEEEARREREAEREAETARQVEADRVWSDRLDVEA